MPQLVTALRRHTHSDTGTQPAGTAA